MDNELAALIQTLINTAKGHDWFYEYADDHSVWCAGNRHRNRIHAAYDAVKALDEQAAMDTWNKFAPVQFRYTTP